MEAIPKSNCTCVGYFQKPHGVKGELILIFEEKFYDSLESVKWIFPEIDGLLVPYPVKEEGIHIRSNTSAIIGLKWVDDQVQAKMLTGKKVFFENKNIVYEPDTLSIDQMIGFEVHGVREGSIGILTSVDDYSGNVVFTVNQGSEELLIPYNEELVDSFNFETKTIVIHIPEGLIE